MAGLVEVQVGMAPVDRFAEVVDGARVTRFVEAAARAEVLLADRTVWNINATASGGGVAEMLQVLLAYGRGAGVDTRWLVIDGPGAFFTVTKGLHNRLHGLGPASMDETDRTLYEQVSRANAREFASVVRSGDIVLLHDPQTAGMAPLLRDTGAHLVWRCHIGADRADEVVRAGWAFLRPYLEAADAHVFSRAAHVHDWMPRDRVAIIPPSVDPFSPKNQELDAGTVRAVLGRVGLLPEDGTRPVFRRRDGSVARVVRAGRSVRGGPLPAADGPLVVQVSRWDRLKDMAGVLEGFVEHVPAPAQLALVGPAVEGVADDPEGAVVLDECARRWDRLGPQERSRVRLLTLPMEDVDENAAMVNAIQRHATVVVQKSLQEGFGLTVSEAMLKRRPVLASRVGGIQDQIRHDRDGLLVDDPADLDAFGTALATLVTDDERRARLGAAGRARVLDRYIGDRHLLQYAELFASLLADG